MKKIILVSTLLLVISSCTLPFGAEKKVDTSFSGLYKTNVHSSIESYEELGTLLSINRHETVDGVINTAISVPGILSGSLSSEYTGLIDGRNSEAFFRNVRVLFTSLVNSGSLSVDEIGLIAHGAESFLSYKNINDVGLIPDELKSIVKKYENTWLNIAEQPTAGMSEEELMGYTIGKNLFTKSLSDIEKYATDYPIWKDTADLGMSGSLHMWSVELDRANILALAKTLALDLSGTGMTDEYAKNLEKNLATLSFSGKIGFDPTNPKVSMIDGTISASGELVAQIVVSKNENNGSIVITNPTDKTNITINYGKTDTKNTFDGTLRKGDIEMGKISGYIEKKDGKFHELSIDASAQGMTVLLKHTMDGDKFTGKLSAIVGTVEWSGTIVNDRLMGLKMNGTAPFGSFTVDLANNGSDTMVRGPILVKSGQETLFSATLALEVTGEKFACILDVISEQFPVHFDLMISGKSTPSNKNITVPTNTKSLQDLMKEIESLSPPETDFPISDMDLETPLDTTDTSMTLTPQ